MSKLLDDRTTLSVLLDFLDTEIAVDPLLRERLAKHLLEAIAG